MSKAAMIKKLLTKGTSATSEIADKVGTTSAFVRNVRWDIRSGGGISRATHSYLEKNPCKVQESNRRYRKKHPHYLSEYRSSHTQERNSGRKLNYEKGTWYKRNSGRLWTDEDSRLVLSFSGTDRELARLIGRSVQAIQGRRCKILPSNSTG